MSPFATVHTNSSFYSTLIQTVCLSCTISSYSRCDA